MASHTTWSFRPASFTEHTVGRVPSHRSMNPHSILSTRDTISLCESVPEGFPQCCSFLRFHVPARLRQGGVSMPLLVMWCQPCGGTCPLLLVSLMSLGLLESCGSFTASRPKLFTQEGSGKWVAPDGGPRKELQVVSGAPAPLSHLPQKLLTELAGILATGSLPPPKGDCDTPAVHLGVGQGCGWEGELELRTALSTGVCGGPFPVWDGGWGDKGRQAEPWGWRPASPAATPDANPQDSESFPRAWLSRRKARL